MAGRSKSLSVADPAPRKRNKRRVTRSNRNKVAFREAMLTANAAGMQRPETNSVPDLLGEVLARAVGGMRYAASEVDKVPVEDFWVEKYDAHGNKLVEPNKWYQLELACRGEVAELADLYARLDLDRRRVELEEAEAALWAGVIREAARRAGLKPAQQRQLLRALDEVIEGSGEEVA